MDLGVYLRVLWRFRALVAAGILVSAGLAFLSHVRVDLDGGVPQVSYRTPLVWASTSTVLITERGFPWGASSLQDFEALQRGAQPKGPQYTDPGRFTQLALLYARLAKSDGVRAIVDRKGRPKGASYSVSPVIQDGITLPMLSISAWSTSPKDARELARVATEAFRSYIATEQNASAIPPERRVKLEVVRSANVARVISGRSIVRPMFVLIIALAATFALAFALENFRPRGPEVGVHAPNALPSYQDAWGVFADGGVPEGATSRFPTSPSPVVPSERKTA
jgi:hypothetical protein